MDGYVSAAMWQDPQATSYMCLSSVLMETSGIPIGFNIITGALYEADTGPALPRDHGRQLTRSDDRPAALRPRASSISGGELMTDQKADAPSVCHRTEYPSLVWLFIAEAGVRPARSFSS
jgi:hypothetical protein